MSNQLKLKYLFVAEFSDGTYFKQTPDDRSSIDPEKRSQFYDLLQNEKKIRRFSLVEKKGFGLGNVVTVDLGTGIFYVNGFPILLEAEKLPTLPDKFELIFYRQRTFNIDVTMNTKTGEASDGKNATEFCEYFIGWQCTIKGKNYQQKLAVS